MLLRCPVPDVPVRNTYPVAEGTRHTVPEVISEVSQALGNLRLTYSKVVVPVFPQLHPGHASVVMCGSWHDSYGDAVVIFDFKALGGPVFANMFV